MIVQALLLEIAHFFYKNVARRIFFFFDPEHIHNHMIGVGESIGDGKSIKKLLSVVFRVNNPMLSQEILGVTFQNPIGLSAGFDYEGRLSQLLPSIGFGFGTVGTITKNQYEGNARPMLGRLPRSKSLMVNKGFKNMGADRTVAKLRKKIFKIPIGISIGRSNDGSCSTQETSIEDIIYTFKKFEKSSTQNTYYELNISCPNLSGEVTFYPPKNLEKLLSRVDMLGIKKPIFVKMPINESNKDLLKMLEVISKHKIAGVIFGNLQKDRRDKALDQKEVAKFPVGNFSGRPTYARSNELIELTYRKYKDRFIIIGTGGVFSAKDAYQKILLGASLVQLITGMVYEGPQIVSEINLGLISILKKDGFTNIHQATGSAVKMS